MRKIIKIGSIITYTILASLSIVVTAFLLSPWQYNSRLCTYSIERSIAIAAPPNAVFAYLGHSGNEAHWSTFVSHITPRNPTQHADGTKESRRRCFQHDDESGLTWDEEILEVQPNLLRTLSIYNLQNALLEAKGLRTQQRYLALQGGHTQLGFAVYIQGSFWQPKQLCQLLIAGYKLAPIFEQNLKNIKGELELI